MTVPGTWIWGSTLSTETFLTQRAAPANPAITSDPRPRLIVRRRRPAGSLRDPKHPPMDHPKRSGWITFAGVAALIAGAYNALSGIAALSDDDTLAAQAQEVLYGIDLTAWGWFWLIVGLVQLLTGVLILQRNMWGLWLGVGIASLSALMTVLVMFVFPLWAIAVLTIDFLVLFALLTESEGFTA
jgi:hypothetical protein